MVERLTEAALAYIEARAMVVDLTVGARSAARAGDPNASQLEDEAFDWGEREETRRRELADAIIRADPQMETRVRKFVRFAADEVNSLSALCG